MASKLKATDEELVTIIVARLTKGDAFRYDTETYNRIQRETEAEVRASLAKGRKQLFLTFPDQTRGYSYD